jgi:hypothetical protein
VCAPDTLTNYVNNVKICTYNSRTFSMFKVVQTVAIDPDDITVTPIKNQTYVGLEFTGFGKAKQPNYALQVSYQVNALDGDGKASTPFSEVLLNLDGISAGGGTTAFAGLAYTIAQDSDSVSVLANTPLPNAKRAAAEFDKTTVIQVTTSMGATTMAQGKKATFKSVKNRFYPAM